MCRFVIYTSILYLGTGCVLISSEEPKWRAEIAGQLRESKWIFESPRRLRPSAVPFLLTLNRDRFKTAGVVRDDRLLLIGTQRWDFGLPCNDYLYLVDLWSGKPLHEQALHYRVRQLYYGPGKYIAFEGYRYDKGDAVGKPRLAFYHLPTLREVGEINLDELGSNRFEIKSIAVGDSLVAAEGWREEQVLYFLLSASQSEREVQPARILSPDEAERLKGDEWPSEVLQLTRTRGDSISFHGMTVSVSPNCVFARRDNPPSTTRATTAEE